jgi:hypothetical protein
METETWIRRRLDDAPPSGTHRERVSIDLRGHGPALNAIAQSRRVTVAALVRTVLAEWLETRSVADTGRGSVDVLAAPVSSQKESAVIKVTLRMPAGHAASLARAARAAELSQGLYVARLINAQPPAPVAPDQRENRAALVRSTAALAAMSSDLHALMRVLRQRSSPELAVCEAMVAQLSEAVLRQLSAASPLIAALAPYRRQVMGDPA